MYELSCLQVSVTTLDLMSTNPDVMPVQQFEDDDPILLLKLGRNQSIKMRAVARKGFGKEHAKYCPVSVCVYQFVADIRVNERAAAELSDDNKKRFVASCPRTVFAYNDDSHSVRFNRPPITHHPSTPLFFAVLSCLVIVTLCTGEVLAKN